MAIGAAGAGCAACPLCQATRLVSKKMTAQPPPNVMVNPVFMVGTRFVWAAFDLLLHHCDPLLRGDGGAVIVKPCEAEDPARSQP